MSSYRVEWPCGCVTETDAWEPSRCPICESDELRISLAAMTAERDAAVAELTRLRATTQPVESQKPSLVWFQSPQGHYWLLGIDGTDWHDVPYAAHKSGISESEPDGTHHRCESWPAACAWIAKKARSKGYHVPSHPLCWDIGEEALNG